MWRALTQLLIINTMKDTVKRESSDRGYALIVTRNNQL